MTQSSTFTQVVGLDLGDRWCQIVTLDVESGEVLERSRVRTTAEALRQRFGRIAQASAGPAKNNEREPSLTGPPNDRVQRPRTPNGPETRHLGNSVFGRRRGRSRQTPSAGAEAGRVRVPPA